MYLINYGTKGRFEDIQKFQSAENGLYFDKVFEYNNEWLEHTPLYPKHPYILSQKHGAGNCLWKPYIILDTMDNIKEGEIILYMDVADEVYNKSFFKFVEHTMNSRDQFLVLNNYANSQWTKRDCFIGMNCDNETYWNHRQLEAGICAFRKSDFNIALIKEWLHYGKSIEIMTDDKSVWGEDLPGFVQTRCDQSILTNLMIKYNLPTVEITEVLNYVHYNALE